MSYDSPPSPPPYNPAPYAQVPQEIPGKTLGIVAMVLSLLNILAIPTALIGAILGHVAYAKSKAAGFGNTPAIVGIIAGWIFTAIGLLLILIYMSAFGAMIASRSGDVIGVPAP